MAGHLNPAVDVVRRQEQRQFLEVGDDRLTGPRFHWVCGWESLPRSQQAFRVPKGQRLETSRAWTLQEMFGEFWSSADVTQGRGFFQRWHGWAIRCRMEPIKKAARMPKRSMGLAFPSRIPSAARAPGPSLMIGGTAKAAAGA